MITKQPVSKMAQSISDMTYSYNETKVPAKALQRPIGKRYY